MIKETIDFDFVIDEINKDIDINIPLQKETLKSKDMNIAFDNIESTLNSLYENSRYLEDAIEYAKTFLTIKVEEYNTDLNSILKSIEDIRDINKNMAYIEYPVIFNKNTNRINDRQIGYTLEPCITNDVLLLGNKYEKEYDYKNCIRKNDSIPYSENLEDIKKEPYRAIYIEEKVSSGGLKENITVNLKEPSMVNMLNIKPINSDIKDITYVYMNGIEEYAGDLSSNVNISKGKLVTQIKFNIVCNRYNISTYYLDKNKLTENTWSKIKEYEYSSLNNPSSKIEAEGVISRVHQKYNSVDKTTETFIDEYDPNNITSYTMYTYMFGIDELKIKEVLPETDGYFISDNINIGTLNEDEFIQLNIKDHNTDSSSIEYSILDGDVEIPIMKITDKDISNERLFPNGVLRFNTDESEIYTIKKDGLIVNISKEDACNSSEGRYSIDYYTDIKNKYTPINSTMRIKCVLRTFDKLVEDIPYVSSINVRKYGGTNLWIDRF